MRLFLSILVTALLVPLTAYAQAAPKQVEVINPVLAVEVVNPPATNQPARFQLVGFTSAVMLGNSGVLGFTLACQAEFLSSRMCTTREVVETVVVPSLSGPDAWVQPVFIINPGGDSADAISGLREPSSRALNCLGWSVDTQLTGLTATAIGSFRTHICNELHPVACCAVVP